MGHTGGLFGRKIHKLRTSKGLTLREVANRLSLQVSYLSDVEHARKAPFSPELLEKFVEEVGGDLNELSGLASLERSYVEINLKREDSHINQLAFALARTINSDRLTEAQAKEIMELLRSGK